MKKLVIVAFALIIIGLVGTASSLYFSDIHLLEPVKWKEEQTVEASSIDKIDIDSAAVDTIIEKGNSDRVKVELIGKESRKRDGEYDLVIDEDRDTLKVKVKHHIKWGITFYSHVQLHVKLPEKMYKSIALKTTSGDITLEDGQANKATFQSNSGDLIIKETVLKEELNAETTSGDIEGENNHAYNLSLKSGSGDISIDHTKVEKQVKIQGESGAIIANQLDAEKSDLSVKSGDINLKDISGKVLAKAQSGDIEIRPNEQAGNVNLETSSGTVLVDTSQNLLPFSIDFKAGSGEASIRASNVTYTTKEEHRVIGKIANGKLQLIVRTKSGDFQLK
ncbi:DUF4097 family beta strand repeat-containing protein [Bacillus sp. PK3_68]|uniref:DUF4097 family beta strand repeat-containing protein n=1 Tax=Bacillus sp. PK3_68 TaxID=2027408 RepID=UPI000E72B2CF|nr:DUF4097 family beta strand repeat-containing protein [Bacillus sp. PK3_68]RJS60017.1 hypothetical protein CJ483_07930 [Bacillus sp. PK3_68]